MENNVILDSQDRSYYERTLGNSEDDQLRMYYEQGIKETNLFHDMFTAAAFTPYMYHADVDTDLNQLMYLTSYMDEPTYENAVEVLIRQGFHAPLSTLVEYLRPHLIVANTPASAPARRRGGMDPTEVEAESESEEDFQVISKKPKKLKLDSVIALDVLKDIYPVSSDVLWDMVNLGIDKKKKLQKIKNADEFRTQIGSCVSDIYEVALKTRILPIHRKEDILKLEADTMLYNDILKWADDSDVFKIVFDGLLNDVNLSCFIRTVFLMAMIQVLLHNISTLDMFSKSLNTTVYTVLKPLKHSFKKVVILDGPFQKNDKLIIGPTLQKYLEELNKIDNISQAQIVSVNNIPVYFTKYYQEDPSDTNWSMKNGPIPNKVQLQELFKKEPSTTHKDMAIRNFVRDAWKADVAIQENALYMTCDKNALMYHQWICKKENIERSAIGVILRDDAYVIQRDEFGVHIVKAYW